MEKTEEECGQKTYESAFVRTSSCTLDVAVPLPTLNPSHSLRRATFPPGEGFVSANYNLSYHIRQKKTSHPRRVAWGDKKILRIQEEAFKLNQVVV